MMGVVRKRIGDARIDADYKTENPLRSYAGGLLHYLCTFSEDDHGPRAHSLARSEITWVRNHGFKACCVRSGKDHHVYTSLGYQTRNH